MLHEMTRPPTFLNFVTGLLLKINPCSRLSNRLVSVIFLDFCEVVSCRQIETFRMVYEVAYEKPDDARIEFCWNLLRFSLTLRMLPKPRNSYMHLTAKKLGLSTTSNLNRIKTIAVHTKSLNLCCFIRSTSDLDLCCFQYVCIIWILMTKVWDGVVSCATVCAIFGWPERCLAWLRDTSHRI